MTTVSHPRRPLGWTPVAPETAEQLCQAHVAELETRLLRRLPPTVHAEDERLPELLGVLAECREAHRTRDSVRAVLMLQAARDRWGRRTVADAAQSLLHPRELEVLSGMARGLANHRIGRELHLSEDTIKTYARRLFCKLGAHDRAHAVAIGYRLGLLDGVP